MAFRTHHRGPGASPEFPANIFQVRLESTGTELQPRHEKKHFSRAARRGRLCVVASPDARGGSLSVQLDMVVYSAILEPGQHIIHELANGRTACVELVQGELSLGGEIILSAGDSTSVFGELAVSLTARVQSEILIVNLGGLLVLESDEPN
jgi:quercetin 2,3-dioxygenase